MPLTEQQSESLRTIIDLMHHVDEKIERLENKYNQQCDILKAELKEVKDDVERMLNVKINGTIGFDAVLKKLWDTTESLRNDTTFESQMKEYTLRHKFWKYLFHTKLGKVFTGMLVIYIILSVLHTLGLPIEPLELVIGIFKLLTGTIH